MLIIFDGLRDLNMLSLALRLVLALFCGGIIGFQRGRKNHPAGLRTHALVCIGAASAMIVNQYIAFYTGNGSDMARMGAQVISGIGFLGAGTVIFTGKSQVKGLSTAAGLWASACMGLAIGIGYYEAGIIMCLLILIVLVWFNKLDESFVKTEMAINIFVEFDGRLSFGNIIKVIKANGLGVNDISDIEKGEGRNRAVMIELNGKNEQIGNIIKELNELEGIIYADTV